MALCYCYGTSRGKGHPMTYLCRLRGGKGVAPVHLQVGNLALGGGGWSAPCFACFIPGEDMLPNVQEAG
jgi:hypothetical protein